jgi:hypothetical protein
MIQLKSYTINKYKKLKTRYIIYTQFTKIEYHNLVCYFPLSLYILQIYFDGYQVSF